MDKITKKKRENTIYLWEENNSPCCGKKTTVRAVGRKQQSVLWEENNSPCCGKKKAQLVGYCYSKYECWPGARVSDMHACRCEFNRHDGWSGATFKDKANGRMQLLQTLLMVVYKCNMHGC